MPPTSSKVSFILHRFKEKREKKNYFREITILITISAQIIKAVTEAYHYLHDEHQQGMVTSMPTVGTFAENV